MTEDTLVDIVNGVAFIGFWLFLVVGALSVSARVAYYRAHGYRRPRLLTRDAIFVGGMALSFGLILAARALNWTGLRDVLWWALATDVPALAAVTVFAYYELFVIERTKEPDGRPSPVALPEPDDVGSAPEASSDEAP